MILAPFLMDSDVVLYQGDAREVLRQFTRESVDCVVTSPPYYGLRDYGTKGQIGNENTMDEYITALVEVFQEVRAVLKDTGTVWLNLGDSYANTGYSGSTDSIGGFQGALHRRAGEQYGSPPKKMPEGLREKELCGIPWRVALALQADGWWLRCDIIWSKPDKMPESATDRPTRSHEYVFLLTKKSHYWWDQEATREPYAGSWTPPPEMDTLDPSLPAEARRGPDGRRKTVVKGADGSIQHRDGERWAHSGRNMRSVWEIPTGSYKGAHFAVFPEELPRRCILAGCPEGGTVLDPFSGSGTTLKVARDHGRKGVGIELNEDYLRLSAMRLQQLSLLSEVD